MTVRNDRSDSATVLDARLVPCALAAWGVTLLGLYTGWRIVTVVAVAAVVGCAVTVRLVATGRIPRGGARILLAALAVVAGFGPAAGLRMWAADQHPIASAAERGAWAGVVLVPTDDPRRIRSAAFDDTPRVRIPARLEQVTVGGRSMDTGGSVVVFAPADSWGDLLPGQSVTTRVRVAPHTGPGTTVAVLRAENAPTALGPPPMWQQWAGTVRDRLTQVSSAVLPADRAGLLPGLVVGDTTALTDEVREDFRVAGLTHLTAVSGANVSIVLGAVLLLVRAAGLGPRSGTVLAATALVAFIVVVRPSASVVRAAAMGSIGLLAFVTGRERQALPALCTAVGVLLVLVPDLAVDVGFALSVSATAALIVAAPPVVTRLVDRGWPRPVAEVMAMSLVAFAATAPLVAAVSGTVSVVSVAANVLVAPVLAPLTVLGSLVAVAAFVVPWAGEMLARGTGPFLWWLISVADRAASMPSAEFEVPDGPAGALVAAVLVVVVWSVARHRRVRITALVIAVAVAAVWLPVRMLRPGWPGAEWVLVACDVGQGDALVLATGDGRAVVVDTGPEPEPVDRCLRRLRIRGVALLVVSHLHADHAGGIRGVLGGRSVEAVVVGPGAASDDAADVLDPAIESGVVVREVAAGAVLRAGDLEIRVVGPAARGTGGSENDDSLVLVVDTVVGRILLPGDAEEAALDALVRSGIDVRADVLKVPHHGSRTTPARFLTAVRPSVALVSAGRDNLFGHPHPEIVSALAGMGARVLRTDLHGDVAVVRAGSGALAVVSDVRGTIEP
ncbi:MULTISPECIES: DNA internalization-related competence protein ComEC/Rec2 [Rhodococcus]|uniref:DNA internalization-related competence protein ComEC/Rec2 n=1 Tax=Rhodococcus TaxID=1827 RepID=UPI000B5A5697|nr:DNA internalization-related competence protein ComEC/Rec2 [Rhodococcus sp. BUPNP1]MXQ76724.1 DNA internalization-related competence protein ComEC/Rec2 [Rhodococcus rhodochrous]OWY82777.1 DNA internalization-related competence protein ComEC/Rec2 [Rhodococcus sp. BUPNP1]